MPEKQWTQFCNFTDAWKTLPETWYSYYSFVWIINMSVIIVSDIIKIHRFTILWYLAIYKE